MILLLFVECLCNSLWVLSLRRVVTTLKEGSLIPCWFFPIEFGWCPIIKDASDVLAIVLRDEVSNRGKDSLHISVLRRELATKVTYHCT